MEKFEELPVSFSFYYDQMKANVQHFPVSMLFLAPGWKPKETLWPFKWKLLNNIMHFPCNSALLVAVQGGFYVVSL